MSKIANYLLFFPYVKHNPQLCEKFCVKKKTNQHTVKGRPRFPGTQRRQFSPDSSVSTHRAKSRSLERKEKGEKKKNRVLLWCRRRPTYLGRQKKGYTDYPDRSNSTTPCRSFFCSACDFFHSVLCSMRLRVGKRNKRKMRGVEERNVEPQTSSARIFSTYETEHINKKENARFGSPGGVVAIKGLCADQLVQGPLFYPWEKG